MADETGENEDAEAAADEEEEAPAVELGEREPVEGAPLGRIASRLTWPQEKSEIQRKMGDSTIRTPAGPQPLSTILEDVDVTYFARRQEFVESVRDAVGIGPVPTTE